MSYGMSLVAAEGFQRPVKARSRRPISDGKRAQVMFVCMYVCMYVFQGYLTIQST